jgi:hypothetical protein
LFVFLIDSIIGVCNGMPGWGRSLERRDAMEVKDAISLMFLFGMFILALLTYIGRSGKKK